MAKVKDVDAKYLALESKIPIDADFKEDSKVFTQKELRAVLPPTFSSNVTKATVTMINDVIRGSEIEDNYKEQFVYYSNVLADPRFNLPTYINAIQYVSFRSLGYSISRAWGSTFPKKLNRLVSEGASNSTIYNHAKSYNNTLLVTKILAQTMVPTWILNQHHYQDAINRQVWLMHNAKSENVQTQAAKCLVDALARPEVAEIEITHTVNSRQESAIDVYKREAKKLAQAQLEAIKGGVTLEAIAESKLEPEGVEDD